MNEKTFRPFSRFSPLALLLVFAAIVLIASFVPPAKADDAALVSFGAPTTITNAATNTTVTGSVLKIDKQHGCAFVLKTSGDQAGTGNVVVQLARSYDGTTFESSPPATLRFTNALAGATTVVGIHEIADKIINSTHSLKITSIGSAEATAKGTNTVMGLLKKLER